jgi:hypothetical protein
MTSIDWVSWDAALAWGRLVASLSRRPKDLFDSKANVLD